MKAWNPGIEWMLMFASANIELQAPSEDGDGDFMCTTGAQAQGPRPAANKQKLIYSRSEWSELRA